MKWRSYNMCQSVFISSQFLFQVFVRKLILVTRSVSIFQRWTWFVRNLISTSIFYCTLSQSRSSPENFRTFWTKTRFCIIWRCLHLMISTSNVSDKWNVRGFERMLSCEQYPEEKSRLWLSSFKKIDQPSWRTTRRNYKHIPQIVCISSRFRELHLLLMGIWAIRSPLKIHCYTCMSLETCWSRLIYTKLSSRCLILTETYS